jgi:hypothetical protein
MRKTKKKKKGRNEKEKKSGDVEMNKQLIIVGSKSY